MIRNAYPHNLVVDEKEEYRLEQIELKKQRGKGAPKKRTKEGKSIDAWGSIANHGAEAKTRKKRGPPK
jgi:hypothetical protein